MSILFFQANRCHLFFHFRRPAHRLFGAHFFPAAPKENSAPRTNFFCDPGIYQTLRPKGFLADDGNLILGIVWEWLVAQHLRAWCDYMDGEHKLHHWKMADATEVDFVIHGETFFWAIEVNSSAVRAEHLAGLVAFGRDYPEAKLILLHGGLDTIMRNGILFCARSFCEKMGNLSVKLHEDFLPVESGAFPRHG